MYDFWDSDWLGFDGRGFAFCRDYPSARGMELRGNEDGTRRVGMPALAADSEKGGYLGWCSSLHGDVFVRIRFGVDDHLYGAEVTEVVWWSFLPFPLPSLSFLPFSPRDFAM